MDAQTVVNIAVTHTGDPCTRLVYDFRRAVRRLRIVTVRGHGKEAASTASSAHLNGVQNGKMHPDMRRPPPGGRAGVVSTADSGGGGAGPG